MQADSILDLMIIVPILAFSYATGKFGLFLQSLSRLLRINKITAVLKLFVTVGDSDVSKKIFQILFLLLILMYISAGVYMVIENFEPENLSKPYTFDLCIYFIFVTISTVGYGDYYPLTDYG
mmetsp:Transcript_14927/g.10436  ORF Transcript_14927/g.10436 Transcript_14927/m.10436 type:complete len:122 (+) Transcript_14927:475-840(+)